MKLKLYIIRQIRKDELKKLQNFLNTHWRKNSILSISDTLFEFQHGKAENGLYDFLVAEHLETGEFHAVLGFINSSTYDASDWNHPACIWGALWKVRDDVYNKEISKIGLGILYHLIKMFPGIPYCTLGLSKFSRSIYDAIHFRFATMAHYYIANPDCSTFEIAANPIIKHICASSSDVKIELLTEVPEIECLYLPQKNKAYIEGRYTNHPFYNYVLWGIYIRGELKAVWVIRPIGVNQSVCLRLVDMIGQFDYTCSLLAEVHHLLRQYNAEYIDCYNYGIDSSIFNQWGFVLLSGETIIPNYFEPFEKCNVDLHCAYYASSPVVMFKADGDQDRPNSV